MVPGEYPPKNGASSLFDDFRTKTKDTLPSEIPIQESRIKIRCELDPVEPFLGLCLAKVTTDDRQSVSHFFGRNKKATASIDETMFPLLCRSHYQKKRYRLSAGKFASFQCDCILKTMENMTRKKLIDHTGKEWPWWCGFELQLQKQLNEHRVDGQADRQVPAQKDLVSVEIVSSYHSGSTENRLSAKQSHRKHKSRQVVALPDWLRQFCIQDRDLGEIYGLLGDRKGVRYSFEQLTIIVQAIKTWCFHNDEKLPAVEALPISIGSFHESELKIAKKDARSAIRRTRSAQLELKKAKVQVTKNPASFGLQSQIVEAQTELENANQYLNQRREVVKSAELDLEETRSTIPGKRQTKGSMSKIVPEASEDAIGDAKAEFQRLRSDGTANSSLSASIGEPALFHPPRGMYSAQATTSPKLLPKTSSSRSSERRRLVFEKAPWKRPAQEEEEVEGEESSKKTKLRTE